MPHWVATSYGALDLRNRPEGAEGAEYAVVPTVPGEPLILLEEAAALWRRLAETADGVDGSTLSDADRALLLEFAASGIASPDLAHPSRTAAPPEPWLSSMFHELVYALVANVCREISVRAVFIKGPVLRAQGLREREHSGDVDVWVKPGSQLRVAEAMTAWGWEFIPSVLHGTRLSHAISLDRGSWGCEIDVHVRFPGVGLGDADAFTAIDTSAERRSFAGTDAAVACAAHNAVIAALHTLRPQPGRSASAAAVGGAASFLRRAGEDAGAASAQLAAGAALRPALETAFPEVSPTTDHVPPEWWWRSAPTAGQAYLRALSLVRLREQPRVLLHFVWPNREYMARSERIHGGRAPTLARARIDRVVRGIRQTADRGSR